MNTPDTEKEHTPEETLDGGERIENELAYALTINEQGRYEKNLETAKLYLSAYVQVVITEHHQELQKAREEERRLIKLRINYDRRKGIPAEETVNDIYDSIELKDQSELDQPTCPSGCDGDKIYTECPLHHTNT